MTCAPALLWLRSGPMLRFPLGGIPVKVHLSHLLFSALLGVLMVRDMPALDPKALAPSTWVLNPSVWPYHQLLSPGPDYGRTATWVALSWMFIIFISALVHEVGHALALRLFGYRPSIELLWLGGATRPNASTPIPW